MKRSILAQANLESRKRHYDLAHKLYLQALDVYKSSPLKSSIQDNIDYVYKQKSGRYPLLKETPDFLIVLAEDTFDELVDVLRRVTYFFSSLPSSKIWIVTKQDIPDKLPHTPDFDQSIFKSYSFFRAQIDVVSDLESARNLPVDIVLGRKVKGDEPYNTFLNDMRASKKVYFVDKKKQRHEGSFWIHSVFEYYDKFDGFTEANRRKFSKLSAAIKTTKSYLFASGPTLDSYPGITSITASKLHVIR